MTPRHQSSKTKNELISSLHYIFPIKEILELDKAKVETLLYETSDNKERGNYLFQTADENYLVAVLYDTETPKNAYCGFLITLIQKPHLIDISFGNYFCKVFNDDVKALPVKEMHSELWLSHRQTQFRRAIAKYTAFSTEPMLEWLQVIENSTSLKYEGNTFSICLFMTKQREWIKDPLKTAFVEFAKPIPFEKCIMSEKWIRATTNGGKIGLAGVGLAGDIFGMFAIPDENIPKENVLSPHEDITSITNLLVPGTCLFLTTENGDIYLMLAKGATFYKTQGRWHYLNYANIQNTLVSLLKDSIAIAILQLSLNLAYEKQGGLIFIPDDIDTLQEIVPDYAQAHKVSEALRNTIKNLNVVDSIQRKIIMASSNVDGALVISSDGKVLDVACMIGQPTQKRMAELHIPQLERFPGARSTAAWNASLYGIALKVSEDGPITIFRHGVLISHIG